LYRAFFSPSPQNPFTTAVHAAAFIFDVTACRHNTPCRDQASSFAADTMCRFLRVSNMLLSACNGVYMQRGADIPVRYSGNEPRNTLRARYNNLYVIRKRIAAILGSGCVSKKNNGGQECPPSFDEDLASLEGLQRGKWRTGVGIAGDYEWIVRNLDDESSCVNKACRKRKFRRLQTEGMNQ
jgi:hypothetical protein